MTNFNSHGVANHHASNRNLGISSNRLSQEQNSLLRANNTKLDTIDGVLDNIKLDTAAIKTSVELLDNAVDGNELQVDVVSSALPSGAATESTLAATESGVAALDTRLTTTNSKLDTLETSLTAIETSVQTIDDIVKEEDAAHSSGDKGVMLLGVRQSVQADFGADGDYVPISINDDGEIRVTAGSGGGGGDATAANQTTMIGHLSNIETAVELIDNAISGSEMQVDVVSSALPSGAATSALQGGGLPAALTASGNLKVSVEEGAGGDASAANQTTMIGSLSTIAGDTTSLDTKVTACNTGAVVVSSSALPSGAATESSLSSIDGKVTACNTGAVVVSSSALPSGASSAALQGGGLPAALTASGNLKVSVEEGAGGDASAANQTTMIGSLSTIAGDTTSLDTKVTACDTGAVVVSSSALPSGAATESSLSSIDGKVTACNTGAVVVSSSALPSGASSAALQGGGLPAALTASGNLKVSVEEGAGGDASAANQTTMIGSLSTIAGDTTSIDGKITACNTGAVVVSSSALPSGAATESSLSSIDGKVTACNTGAVVVSSSALPSGASSAALQGGGLPAALTAGGNLKVSVEEGAGGDASAANQTTMIGSLSTIAGDTTSLDSKVTACNTGAVVVSSSALPTGAALESTLSALNTKVTACDTGSVTVTSNALPTGASTAANQATANGSLATIAGDTTSIDGKITTCNTGAVVVSSSALPSGAATESTLSTLNTKVLQGYDASISSGGTGLIQVLTYGRDASGNLDALNVDNNGHLKVISAVVENKGSFANIQNGTLNFGVTSSSVDVSDYNHAVFLYEDTNTSTFDDPVLEISPDNTNFYKAPTQPFTTVRGSKREGAVEYKLHGITHLRIKNESTADNFTNCKATIVGTPN